MQCTNDKNYNEAGLYLPAVPPCGKCLSCKSTRRFEWASRIMLESTAYQAIQFVTLTYSEDNLTTDPSQLRKNFQNWTKRLRYKTGHQPRYFACMEYGTRYGRPHYHVLLFGRSSSFETRRGSNGAKIRVDPIIEDTWNLGSTYVKDCPTGHLLRNVAIYVANYVLKNLWSTEKSDKQEWALMSRTPYIGQSAVKWLSELIDTPRGQNRCSHLGTIPNKVKIADKFWKIPLRIRRELGEIHQIPVTEVPYKDNTVMDYNGKKFILGKPAPLLTFGEAAAMESRLSRKIRSLKRTNTSDNG